MGGRLIREEVTEDEQRVEMRGTGSLLNTHNLKRPRTGGLGISTIVREIFETP